MEKFSHTFSHTASEACFRNMAGILNIDMGTELVTL